MKMSTLKLVNLRDLCKDPKNTEKVSDYLSRNPGMDLIGEGHGGSIRAAIKANNPATLTNLLKYHKKHNIDIHEVGSDEYNNALFEFNKVLGDIIDENWNFIEERYIFSEAIQKVLAEYHRFGNEEDGSEQDVDSDTDEQDLAASDDVLGKDDNTHHGDTDYIDEQPVPEYSNGCLLEAVLGRDLSGDNAHGVSPEVY